MTLLTDLQALSTALTPNAKATVIKKGTDLAGLITNAEVRTIELQKLLTIIITLHPTTGSSGQDATNAASLATILLELA